MGNQTVQRLVLSDNKAKGFDFAEIAIEPKLKISQPGDAYEQQADSVAEQITAGMAPSASQEGPAMNDGVPGLTIRSGSPLNRILATNSAVSGYTTTSRLTERRSPSTPQGLHHWK